MEGVAIFNLIKILKKGIIVLLVYPVVVVLSSMHSVAELNSLNSIFFTESKCVYGISVYMTDFVQLLSRKFYESYFTDDKNVLLALRV